MTYRIEFVPRRDRDLADIRSRIVVLQRAFDTVQGEGLSAEVALDMLIRDEGLKLSKLQAKQVRALRREGTPA